MNRNSCRLLEMSYEYLAATGKRFELSTVVNSECVNVNSIHWWATTNHQFDSDSIVIARIRGSSSKSSRVSRGPSCEWSQESEKSNSSRESPALVWAKHGRIVWIEMRAFIRIRARTAEARITSAISPTGAGIRGNTAVLMSFVCRLFSY